MTESNNILQFPSVHDDTLADALGLEKTYATLDNRTYANGAILTTTSSNANTHLAVNNNAALCLKCGAPYFSHPRLGISHVCMDDIANAVPNDTQYARENLYDVVKRTAESIDKINAMIEESPTARNFEVLGQLLTLQSATAEKLMVIQEKARKLAEAGAGGVLGGGSVNIANAVFVGTNAELLDLIKGKSHKIIEHDDMREDQ